MTKPKKTTAARNDRTGVRQLNLGLVLLVVGFVLWEARDFLPTLVSTRVVGAASLNVRNEAVAQLKRAFAAAQASSRVEASLTAHKYADSQMTNFELLVPAATADRALANLTTITQAIKTVFPSSESDLSVWLDDKARPEPNANTRRLGVAVSIGMVLLLFAGEIMMVRGGYHQGMPRAGLLLMAAAPVGVILFPNGTPSHLQGSMSSSHHLSVDFAFLTVLLPITAAGALFALWLTRKPPAARKTTAELQK